jgi:hypothetical protein
MDIENAISFVSRFDNFSETIIQYYFLIPIETYFNPIYPVHQSLYLIPFNLPESDFSKALHCDLSFTQFHAESLISYFNTCEDGNFTFQFSCLKEFSSWSIKI